MGFSTMEAAYAVEGLNATDKLVLMTISNFKNEQTGDCFPSMQRLVTACNLCKNTIKASLRRLENAGIVNRTQKPVKNGFVWAWDIDCSVRPKENYRVNSDPCHILTRSKSNTVKSCPLTGSPDDPKQGNNNNTHISAHARGQVMNSPAPAPHKEEDLSRFVTPLCTITTTLPDGTVVTDNLDPNYTGNSWDVPWCNVVLDFVMRYLCHYKHHEFDFRYIKFEHLVWAYISQRKDHIEYGKTKPVLNWKWYLADNIDISARCVDLEGEKSWDILKQFGY